MNEITAPVAAETVSAKKEFWRWQENVWIDETKDWAPAKIVTCGIDHVPPPLLQQLKPGGTMVIPVGPPGAQHVLKVIKQQNADASFTITRSDIYNGRVVPFVPFTKLENGKIVGTHSN